MDITGLKVAVVGGGIGGLAAACALAQRGARVELFEQAAGFSDVGAGIQVSANGQKVLAALGAVGQSPPDGTTVSSGTVMRTARSGRAITTLPAPDAGPTWYVHRADLLALLQDAAVRAGVGFRFGRVVTPGALDHDLIVAADGSKSVWRSFVDGPDQAQFTGQVAWRALIPGNFTGDMATLTMGHRAHMVTYPLRGRSLMNVVAVEERSSWTEESWNRAGDCSEFRHRFSDFGADPATLLALADTVHVWALHARPVAQTWVRDNVILLGDSAHPTLPFMAQGACLALEDALVLGRAFEVSADIGAALKTCVQARLTRARRVVGLAKGNAWRFHLGKPLSWGAQVVLAAGGAALARRLEWVYDYDAGAAFGR